MYTTMLCSTGNPDHGQYAAPSPAREVRTDSVEAAASACRDYIEEWGLGGGNWCGNAGKVFKGESIVATIAYNGRICFV